MTDEGPGGPKRRGGRLVVGLVVLTAVVVLIVLVVFRGNDKPAPKSTSRTSPTATAPSPTPTNPQVGEDVDAAFRAINAIRTRAVLERRPELVDQIYRPDCGCRKLKETIEKAASLHQQHRGYDPQVIRVIQLKEGFVGGPNVANLRVITEQGPYSIVTDDGALLDEDPGWAPQSAYWLLTRTGPESPWMVLDLEVEGPADDVLGPGWRESPR